MIIKTTDIQELNKIIRNQLILQSGLSSNQVMNGVSIHGQDLLERINQYAYKTYTLQSSFVVFVLESRDSDSNFSQVQDDGNIRVVASYKVHCYIYGYNCQTLANVMVGRLRTEYARLDLQQNGVYLADVSEPITSNDFINDSLMIRTDFFINISCEMLVQQASMGDEIKSFNINTEEI